MLRSTRPTLGLSNKGRIEEGCDADIILINEGETARLKKAPEYSNVGVSYVGREVGVLPELVVVSGRVASRVVCWSTSQ